MIKEYIAYLKDNPEGYWFKAKLYGWGWAPARWQGWAVLVISIAVVFLGIYIGDYDDAPGAALIGALLAIVLIFIFGYWKGERPRWNWGIPEKYKQPKEKE
jgi:drug/metabolite transporter (DMT)-like permease